MDLAFSYERYLALLNVYLLLVLLVAYLIRGFPFYPMEKIYSDSKDMYVFFFREVSMEELIKLDSCFVVQLLGFDDSRSITVENRTVGR